MGWRGFLRREHRITEVSEGVPAERVTHLREELLFLLLHVVAHVLDQHGHLGVEALLVRIHGIELGQQPLDDVVLLEALEDDVVRIGNGRPGHRVEKLLLYRGVLRQLFDDAIDQIALLDVGTIARLLETPEKALRGLVVIFEHPDCIHKVAIPRTSPQHTARDR